MSSINNGGAAVSGPLATVIRDKVTRTFAPVEFEIFNDSAKHAHHAAMRGSTNTAESHFRLYIVSQEFDGKSQPARHRMVYNLFKQEMAQTNGLHALQLQTKTPSEVSKLAT